MTPNQSLDSVHAFTICEDSEHVYGPTDTSYWLSRCTLIPNTRCITLPLFYSRWLTEALQVKDETTGRPKILLNLEILAFDVLVDGVHSLDDNCSHEGLDTAVLGLVRMMETRRDMGAPVKEVRIRKVMAGCDVWERVRELATVTVWR